MQKVALVTGAAKRIGREIAMTLAKDAVPLTLLLPATVKIQEWLP